MAEQSELILDGDVCQICGIYLGEGDGFPVTCSACGGDWEDENEEEVNNQKEESNA